MAMAIDNGSATIATVNPAIASARNCGQPYPSRRMVTSFGVNSSAKLGALSLRVVDASMSLRLLGEGAAVPSAHSSALTVAGQSRFNVSSDGRLGLEVRRSW